MNSVRACIGLVAFSIAIASAACGCKPTAPVGSPDGRSDPEKVRAADVSILFVGNSHTSMHDVPKLVCEMIRFQHPEKTTYAHAMGVGFLEDVARDPRFRDEIESREWKFVILQAQKISVSGKHDYSRAEGIDFAKAAKTRGATVYFFCEWGLKGVPDNGSRQERVYREMAAEAGVGVAAVNRAWETAFAARPEMPLHDFDGNHQSPTGAFLTAAFLCGTITGESPAPLASFPYEPVSAADRAFLADSAAKALGK
jgi:hypothetical protein